MATGDAASSVEAMLRFGLTGRGPITIHAFVTALHGALATFNSAAVSALFEYPCPGGLPGPPRISIFRRTQDLHRRGAHGGTRCGWLEVSRPPLRSLVASLMDDYRALEARILSLDREIERLARTNEVANRLTTGRGPCRDRALAARLQSGATADRTRPRWPPPPRPRISGPRAPGCATPTSSAGRPLPSKRRSRYEQPGLSLPLRDRRGAGQTPSGTRRRRGRSQPVAGGGLGSGALPRRQPPDLEESEPESSELPRRQAWMRNGWSGWPISSNTASRTNRPPPAVLASARTVYMTSREGIR